MQNDKDRGVFMKIGEEILLGNENLCFELNSEQLDTLKELGNIGSGNAIVALSKLLNRRVEVSLTNLEILPFWKLPERIGGPSIEVFGIYSIVNGEQNLSILQIFTKDSIINIINDLIGVEGKKIKKFRQLSDIDDFSKSIISEMGNILAGHYTSSLANLMNIKLVPDVPKVAFDHLGAILDGIIAMTSESIDFLVLINTKLEIEELRINGIFCFFPAVETIKKLFKALNIEFEFKLK